ncbi:iron ABC transporter ATP-binding protein [Thermotoga maritima MSB8]|uniref:Iron(III) ABC transporter, ATP-binding protein n=1 Tax=Thermotoga maritima (strain ATCC 43589 / DSM 3109 / JCM 10099 / NBRC 100826 / MSB8) TaxID=243274 RepID=Q9WXT3_THEMA|nr:MULTISPECIES: ABC transporter ATP-binding protein [Thermotoga]AAD35172.1 iron(III) ABC transporter, ATP-binding protein [Thermotoga maritima MSB8]AGL49001.1 Vitamin B12 ABC transporter, ATPase component BtuD [Thermotoga maritima MSB8]AHD18152.1 ABC transporter [Thermotoga maritima MSB8]AKE26024.1 iron ABC transporter ATP-binding protein [Thermotoga maritima]AKE27886.1 iron ABC transporter ATP-binding protein [Thermotoga maritima MSB8]
MEIVRIENLFFQYRGGFSLKNINLSVKKGEFFGIIGPNGSGKTTLLKILVGIFRPQKGTVQLLGRIPWETSRKEMAKIVTLVSQDFFPSYDFSVKEIVEMGRLPHLSLLSGTSRKDEEIVLKSLELTGTLKFVDRNFWTLSSGERRKVVLSKAIVQDTEILLIDELTAHLDYNNVSLVGNVLKRLKESGKTIISVFHDINVASALCDRIGVMKNGEMIKTGAPPEVVTEEVLRNTFETEFVVLEHPVTGRPLAFLK